MEGRNEPPASQRDQLLSRHTCVVNQVPISVYDTVGIEKARRDDWIEVLEQERERRNCRTKLTDWFHVVVYCIDAEIGRVEDVDARAISGIYRDGNSIKVLLTKADKVLKDEVENLRAEVKRLCPCLRDECIVAMSNGDCKPRLSELVFSSYVQTITMLLPCRCKFLMQSCLTQFVQDTKRG